MNSSEQKADWLAWALQFIFGLFVGFCGGFYLLARGGRTGRSSRMLVKEPYILFFLLGAALVTAGIASYYGDRFWLGDNYRVIPPDDMPHSSRSTVASVLTGLSGCGFLCYALFPHFFTSLW